MGGDVSDVKRPNHRARSLSIRMADCWKPQIMCTDWPEDELLRMRFYSNARTAQIPKFHSCSWHSHDKSMLKKYSKSPYHWLELWSHLLAENSNSVWVASNLKRPKSLPHVFLLEPGLESQTFSLLWVDSHIHQMWSKRSKGTQQKRWFASKPKFVYLSPLDPGRITGPLRKSQNG